jgi:GTP-sensing pleiotropic transcriptional regulator CodY
MSYARVAMVDIGDKVLETYNTNEGWVVKKMKLKYVNRIVAILPIIYRNIRCGTLVQICHDDFPKKIMENLIIWL